MRGLLLGAIAWLIAGWRRGWTADDLIGVALVVLSFLANAAFVRDPLSSHLPDAMVPFVLLGAWLAGRVLQVANRTVRLAAGLVMVIVAAATALSLAAVEKAGEQWQRTNLWLGIGEVPRLFREKTRELTTRFSRAQLPDGRLVPLVPLFEYFDRCTTPKHHLLVAGNAPEVYVYARRPFAAGQSSFVEGYASSDGDQERQVRRAEAQVVAFVIELSDQYEGWRSAFPRLDAYVQSRFRALGDIPVDTGRQVHVLVHAGLPPNGVDSETGWPCYR
jgi:hypothetical protein